MEAVSAILKATCNEGMNAFWPNGYDEMEYLLHLATQAVYAEVVGELFIECRDEIGDCRKESLRASFGYP